ncbi:sugar phosphate isomerase/epimerase family protein [Sphingobium fluviale]|nr:TIM barrel protein [Sphingobium fluviale]
MARVMWSGTVRALPLREQARATRIAGCSTLSVTPFSYALWQTSGLSTREMLAIVSDEGVRLNHLEPITRWHSSWLPKGLDPAICPPGLIGFDMDDFFRIADALEIDNISAMVSGDADDSGLDAMADNFAVLCERATRQGVRCDLEFVPMWGLPDLASAWYVLERAGSANCGLIFDTWHYLRGRQDPELLASIPGDRISHVQIADGAATPVGGDLLIDCLAHRCLPGEGDLPIEDVLQQLAAIGGLNSVGLEVFSARLDTMNSQEIGRACLDSFERVGLSSL